MKQSGIDWIGKIHNENYVEIDISIYKRVERERSK